LSGIHVCYIKEGPTLEWQQPHLGVGEKAVLKKKIQKFMDKGYIAPVVGQIGSLIKYFAIPKRIINGVVQDWRAVFHVGANKLKDCVWTPLFSLPTINSLLQIINEHTLIADQDMGEMFLNFNLHPNTVRFACINVRLLDFTSKECPH
jgi:hypothetical protein